MLTALQAAAVIAATAFAVLATAGVYALVKLARLISAASGVVADFRVRGDLLVGRANSAVDRAHEQLARTDAITANMDEVAANIAELTADVSMLSGAVHTLLGGPLGRLAAFSFGVRRAIALRRGGTDSQRLLRMRQPLVRGDPGPAGSGASPDSSVSPRGGAMRSLGQATPLPQRAASATRADARSGPAALQAAWIAAHDHDGQPRPGQPGRPGRRASGRRLAR
jgi:uncharacterized protein YoxC